jgi:hypothetical protein
MKEIIVTKTGNDEYEVLYERLSTQDLQRLADDLLRRQGLTIWGRNKRPGAYNQARFETGMIQGAYSRSSESRRRR